MNKVAIKITNEVTEGCFTIKIDGYGNMVLGSLEQGLGGVPWIRLDRGDKDFYRLVKLFRRARECRNQLMEQLKQTKAELKHSGIGLEKPSPYPTWYDFGK